jgi:dTDP-4-dehydrorhamnose 3,5-epimerase
LIVSETAIAGAFVVDIERLTDDRGFFARSFCVDELEAFGIELKPVQANISWNETKGTLRGMHYQDEAAPEPKLIGCSRGAIWDVIVDLRPESPTFMRHAAVELTADNRRQLFAPALCAHGFLTLAAGTEVRYLHGAVYSASASRGLRYDDPSLGLRWPIEVEVISPRDASWPLLAAGTERT